MGLFDGKKIEALKQDFEKKLEEIELTKAKQIFEVEQRMVEISEKKALEKAQEIHATWLEAFEKSNGKKEDLEAKSLFIDPYQLLESVGYRERPMMLGFDQLRLMSERNPVVAAVINTRVNQVASFSRTPRTPYDVGFEFMLRDKDEKVTKADEKRMKELTGFIEATGFPGKIEEEERDDFDAFLRKFSRDSLTYDQATSEIVPSRKGTPGAFYAIDACTIRLATTPEYWRDRRKVGGYYEKGKTTKEDIETSTRMMASWKGAIDDDIKPEDIRYVQILMGRVINTYTEKEFIFGIRNPRTSVRLNGYGTSELEILVNTVVAHMWTEEHNRRFFSQGSAPKGIIHFEGANINQEHLQSFRRQWHAQIAGVYNAWRTPIIASPAKLNYTNLHSNNRQMEFSSWLEYLVKIICAVYLIDPAEINFDLKGSAHQTQGPMFESQNEAKQKMSRDRGLKPLLKFIEGEINKNIIWQIDPRIEFQFVGLDAKTEEQRQKLRTEQLQNYRTIDEIRIEEDYKPLGEEKGGDIIMNNVYTQYMLQLKMQQQQQQMMGGMGGGEDFGQEGEEGKYDFGQEGGEEEAPPGGGAPKEETSPGKEFGGGGAPKGEELD
ncbi:hypothetical protein A2Z67_04430 [Candidatus Woesebacteria bacterium RBG_13_36_22]|uniref:Phage portal protein n=1 Tax=Candidatus Woesebacteria bacterium RBG_13_36_22 TaxID=1802478 RepID=A0A1F7X389_9BACT|nr:MAG: hypothetical protein A2Z67_04430 [Candidatus Woesebacteria bacterium RBG_13_36_22]